VPLDILFQKRLRFIGSVGLRVAYAAVLYLAQLLAALGAISGHFSTYIASITVVGLLSLIVVKGTPVVIAREVAKRRDVSEMIYNVLRRSMKVIGVGAIICFLFIFFEKRYSYVILSSILFFFAMVAAEVTGAVLRGAEKFVQQLTNMLLGSLLVLGMVLLLEGDIYDYELILIFGIGNLIAAVLNAMYICCLPVYTKKADSGDEGGLFATSILTHLFYSLDRILAPILLPQGVAEIYSKMVVLVGRPFQILAQTMEQYLLAHFSRNRKASIILKLSSISSVIFALSMFLFISGVGAIFLLDTSDGLLISLAILISSAYILWLIYSMIGARIWSLGRSIYPKVYIRYFFPFAVSASVVGITAAGYWESAYILAFMVNFLHLIRAIIMFSLNRRLDLLLKYRS